MARLILFGALGFGIGWAIAGLFNVAFTYIISLVLEMLPYFAYSFAGACGGAGLGLAFRSWKKVVALALAGFLGFGVGLPILFTLGFIGLLPSETSFAMGVGLFGGVTLGLTFGDWKRVLLLGLAGLAGFGIGGAIAATLGMPFVLYPFGVDFVGLGQAPSLLLQHLLVQAMVGLIGGASLGAALGYLEKRRLVAERRPRVR